MCSTLQLHAHSLQSQVPSLRPHVPRRVSEETLHSMRGFGPLVDEVDQEGGGVDQRMEAGEAGGLGSPGEAWPGLSSHSRAAAEAAEATLVARPSYPSTAGARHGEVGGEGGGGGGAVSGGGGGGGGDGGCCGQASSDRAGVADESSPPPPLAGGSAPHSWAAVVRAGSARRIGPDLAQRAATGGNTSHGLPSRASAAERDALAREPGDRPYGHSGIALATADAEARRVRGESSLHADGGEASGSLPREEAGGAARGAVGGRRHAYPTSPASVEAWLSQLDLVGYDGPQFFLAQYAQHLNSP